MTLRDQLAAYPRRELTVVAEETEWWTIRCANAECRHLIHVAKRVGIPDADGVTAWQDVTLADRYPRWCPPCGFTALQESRTKP